MLYGLMLQRQKILKTLARRFTGCVMIYKDRTEVKSQMSVFCRLSSVIWFLAAYCLLPTAYCFSVDSLLKEPVRLIKKGDYNNAIQILDYIGDRYRETIWEKRIHYLLGHTYLKLALSQSSSPEVSSEELKANQSALFDDALKYFKKSAEEYPPLSDYAEYNIAKIYFEQGEYNSAIDTLNSILNKYPLTRLRARVRLDTAKVFFAAGDFLRASTEFKNFITEFPLDEKIAESYYLLGQSLEGLRNKTDAYNAYQFLYYNYPLDPSAELSINRISELEKDESIIFLPPEKKDEIKRVELLMNGKNYNKAIKYFPQSLKVAEGLYMMSKIYWNKGDIKRASSYNDIIVARYPKNIWAGRAIYVNARIKEENGKSDEAVRLYLKLIHFSGLGALSEEAVWRIGWICYQKGEYHKAIENFKKCIELFPDSQYADSSLYWMGRAAEGSGNTGIATDAYQRLTANYPYTYYGHRGYERLTQYSEFGIRNSEFEIESAIRNPQSAIVNWEFSDEVKFHIEKADELIEIGFTEDAREEIKSIPLPNGNNNIPVSFYISQLYSMAESYPDSMSVQNNVIGRLKIDEQNKLTEDFCRLYYPLSYWEIVSKSASENSVDPLLMQILKQSPSSLTDNKA